ncbi:MAG: hypothetical protein M3O70_10665, partial [Actinomycetota bacterium]|nr:hypothetical protein [Actinomycetota bacterium]
STAGFAPCLTDAQLGSKWDGLSDDERGRRESDFYKYVLTYLAQTYQPRFAVDLPNPWERDRFLPHVETPSRPARSRPEDFVLTGTLTTDAAECLAELNPIIVTMQIGDEVLFTLGDAWSSATIALWSEEAVELRRELERLSLVSD